MAFVKQRKSGKKTWMTVYKGRQVPINAYALQVTRGATPKQPYLGPALNVGKDALRGQISKALQRAQRGKTPLTAELDRAVETAAGVVQQRAVALVPVDTGRLRADIHTEKRTEMQRSIGTNVKYARWVEDGTKGGQTIRPVRAKVLAFYSPRGAAFSAAAKWAQKKFGGKKG